MGDNERLFYWNIFKQCQEAGEATITINVSGLEAPLKEGNQRAEAERQRMFDELIEAVYGSRLRRPAAYSEVLWSDLLASVRRLASHSTEAYRKALRKRAVWVEPLFGEAKEWHGSRRFRLRGLEKVNSKALMIASGQNVKRLVASGPRRPKKMAMVAALRPPGPPTSPTPTRRFSTG